MAAPDTLTTVDERKMLDRIKRAVDLVDRHDMSPDDAITKVARDDKLAPGMIGLVCRAYNTGRQLGQWRANDSIMDKLASFALADPAVVVNKIYPPAETKQALAEKTAFDSEYHRSPSWVPNERTLEASRRELGGMIKTASPCVECGNEPCTCAYGECKKGTDQWSMRKAYGHWERAKHAYEEARRHEHTTEDNLKGEVAGLVGYFKQASYNRLPFAQVEHAANAYYGTVAVELLKLAYERAGLGKCLGRGLGQTAEPRAADVRIQKLAFDLEAAPFTIVERCVSLAGDLLTARRWTKEAYDLMKEVEAADLRPFVRATASNAVTPSSRPTFRFFESEKRGYMGLAIGTALGNAASTMVGSYPKPKSELIEDDWLDLESPAHANELRKIKTHAMLNSMMTDPDDPISGADPDKVLSAYNEISQLAPRAAGSSAVLRPLLRKRLAGNIEPFEAKEMVDIEKGMRDSKNVPPSNLRLASTDSEKLLG